VVFFEIDDPETLMFKQARLAAAGIDPGAVFIPGDYESEGVLKLLEANGFRRDVPAHFIWEGNTMYLTKPAVMAVLKELAAGVGQFSIAFDYLSEEIIAGTTGDQAIASFVARFAAIGAPWRFGLNDLDAVAVEAGLTVADVMSIGELHRRLWPDQPADWNIDKHYFLCTLQPAAAS